MLLASTGNAQNVESVKDVKIQIEVSDQSILQVFETIQSKTDFVFAYDENDLNLQKKVNLGNHKNSLGELLLKLSKKAGLKFKQVNNQINVSKKTEKVSEPLEIIISGLKISGKVISSEDGQGLPGVNVILKGTSTGTITDFDGNYSIEVPNEESILVFSFVGFTAQEVVVGNTTAIDIELIADLTALQEIVVIGYGKQKKSDLTGAVGTVKGDEISRFSTANATQAIQGRVAGVRVENNGGAPGAQALVTIRGAGTLSENQPLYVIDGMLTGNMNALNPQDIESITVLKDASASAIYGSRAANGVIIVTTKKGKAGEIGIDVDVSYGSQKVVNTIDWANARQYSDVVNQAIDNDNARILANDPNAEVKAKPEATSTMFDPNINSDIQKASLRSAPMSNMNIRIHGGSENATYSVSANRMQQDGILRNSSFERIGIRTNSTFTKNRFKLEETIGLTRTINHPTDMFNRERDLVPIVPIRDANGNFTAQRADGATVGANNMANSLGQSTLEERTVTRNTLLGNIAGSFEILQGLTYKLNLGLEAYNDYNYRFTPTYEFNLSQPGFNELADLKERNTNYISTLVENTLAYQKTLGQHNLTLLAGYSFQKTNSRRLGTDAEGFPENSIRVADQAATISAPGNENFDNTSVILSYFGRVNYTFDSRYLFTATLRRDGSSLFNKDLRWGVYPSIAVGWNIINESFMNNASFLSDLKLRASYGKIGSNNTQPYVRDAELNVNSSYPLGNNRIQGVSITKSVNELLQWETTITTDIGLEFGLLENKLQFTIDYFKKESEDVIAPFTPSFFLGRSGTVNKNTASLKNEGLEFAVNYFETFGDVKLSVGANFTTLNNEITEIGAGGPIEGGGYTSNGGAASLSDIGQPIGAFYGFKVIGIYQTDEQAINDGRTDGAGAGDFIFQDTDGIPGITDDDRQYLGSPVPDFEYAFNITAEYKSFDLNLFFNGVTGNKILDGTRYRGFFDTEGNYLAEAANGWRTDNTDTNIPRNSQTDAGGNRRMSDFLLSNGAYFRLRNIQIGYTFPKIVTEKLKVSRIRAYGSAQNLFTITDYSGYYPEVGWNSRDRGASANIFNLGVDENAYPTARSFMLGLQVSF
ncbi:MAG: TonB-dependent receptor [Cyclobacteriaceae bacterium]